MRACVAKSFPNQGTERKTLTTMCGLCANADCGPEWKPNALRHIIEIDNKMYVENFTTFGMFVSVHRVYFVILLCACRLHRTNEANTTHHSHVAPHNQPIWLCVCACVMFPTTEWYINESNMREGAHGTNHEENVADVNPCCVPFSPTEFARNKRFIQKVCVGGWS